MVEEVDAAALLERFVAMPTTATMYCSNRPGSYGNETIALMARATAPILARGTACGPMDL